MPDPPPALHRAVFPVEGMDIWVYRSMKNKNPMQEGSQVVARQAGPPARLHLFINFEANQTPSRGWQCFEWLHFPCQVDGSSVRPRPGLHVWAASGFCLSLKHKGGAEPVSFISIFRLPARVGFGGNICACANFCHH